MASGCVHVSNDPLYNKQLDTFSSIFMAFFSGDAIYSVATRGIKLLWIFVTKNYIFKLLLA